MARLPLVLCAACIATVTFAMLIGGLRGASSAPQAPSTQSSGPANDTASTTAGIASAAVIESLAGLAHAIPGARPREINEGAIRGRIIEQP
jgi:hypothetical protein